METDTPPDPAFDDGDGDGAPRTSLARRIGLGLFLALLFFGLASLFAGLLKPLVGPEADAGKSADKKATPAFVRLDRDPPDVVATPALPAPAQPVAPPVDAAATAAVAAMPEALPAVAPPAPLPAGPVVAVMLTELGPNAPAADQAIARLPAAISLAFSPYANSSRALSAKARQSGHDVWVSVPMQPKSYPRVSPGAHTLLNGNSAAVNLQHLDWALGRVDGEIGITNMMGSALTESETAMTPLIGALRAKGLAYVDARSSGRSIGARLARAQGVASAMNDRFLDEAANPAAIDANLKALESMAKQRGRAIGYARALPVTIDRLAIWSETLGQRGITLVPVRAVTTAGQ